MAVYFFTQAELETRLSVSVVRRIYDDNNDGTADTTVVDRLREDATSWVSSRLIPTYGLSMLTYDSTTVPNEVKRIALDVAAAYAAQRHPEAVTLDWEKLLKQAKEDIAEHAAAKRHADSSTVRPRNIGGFQTTSTATLTLLREDGSGGMGDF